MRKKKRINIVITVIIAFMLVFITACESTEVEVITPEPETAVVEEPIVEAVVSAPEPVEPEIPEVIKTILVTKEPIGDTIYVGTADPLILKVQLEYDGVQSCTTDGNNIECNSNRILLAEAENNIKIEIPVRAIRINDKAKNRAVVASCEEDNMEECCDSDEGCEPVGPICTIDDVDAILMNEEYYNDPERCRSDVVVKIYEPPVVPSPPDSGAMIRSVAIIGALGVAGAALYLQLTGRKAIFK